MSRYNKEHYEDVAGLLKAQRELDFGSDGNDALSALAHSFAVLFATDNYGGFDRAKFLAACGLEPKPVKAEHRDRNPDTDYWPHASPRHG